MSETGHKYPSRRSLRFEEGYPAGARFLNERPVWGAARRNGDGEDGREAAGRREVAESGTSAFGLQRGKADADFGTLLGSV
jgi:hypothetical protein